MKQFFNPFNFKAIETKYDSYKFRSRLEARWAVFFNVLDIPYVYEPEGYDLEGTWYLPDFWLPQQQCFIEIKGQKPTEEEIKKANNLALYTNQYTYIISGNIGLPGHKNAHSIRFVRPPIIGIGDSNGIYCGDDTKIPTSLEARIVIQRLNELGMQFDTYPDREGDHCELTVEWIYKGPCYLDILDAQAETDIQILQKLRDMIPFIKECEKELIEIFSLSLNHKVYVVGQDEPSADQESDEWQSCNHCNSVFIHPPLTKRETSHRTCQGCNQGILTNDSPRLLAAYEAARQARF